MITTSKCVRKKDRKINKQSKNGQGNLGGLEYETYSMMGRGIIKQIYEEDDEEEEDEDELLAIGLGVAIRFPASKAAVASSAVEKADDACWFQSLA